MERCRSAARSSACPSNLPPLGANCPTDWVIPSDLARHGLGQPGPTPRAAYCVPALDGSGLPIEG
jgi:hypothetical protein